MRRSVAQDITSRYLELEYPASDLVGALFDTKGDTAEFCDWLAVEHRRIEHEEPDGQVVQPVPVPGVGAQRDHRSRPKDVSLILQTTLIEIRRPPLGSDARVLH